MFAKVLINISLLLVFNFYQSFCESDEQNIVSVRLKNGLINGKIETSVNGKQVNVFRGIPYAQPPIGNLRFKNPLPVKEWPQRFDAYNWANPCQQTTKLGFGTEYANNNFSEDCLYLNIWSPTDTTDTTDTTNSIELKPVIFYIHGGALILATSSWPIITGQELSARGDVVFVSMNYRLGTLGFLYTGSDDAPGNVGLWDLSLALEWVNDNIKYFGGDPNKITIMGMSGGSWATSLLTLSPITRNLFQNVILQSGGYTDNLIDGEPEDHIKHWLKAAQLIGCNDDKSKKFNKQIIDCMKEADPSTLVDVITLPEMKTKYKIITPLVVADGQFLPKKPSELLSSGDFKQNLNIMISVAVDEGSFILGLDNPKFNPMNPANLTLSEAITELTQISRKMSDKMEINGEEVAKVYFSGLSDSEDFGLFRRRIGIAFGDYYLGCPSVLMGTEIYKNSGFKANVYYYYFNYKTSGNQMPEWYGCPHGEDMTLTHGIPFIDQEHNSDDDRRVSENLIQILTDFAKNGEPTPQSGAKWPKLYQIDGNIVTPYYEFTKEPKPETNFGIGLKTTECQYLWRKYLL